jgi:hypothetical protein
MATFHFRIQLDGITRPPVWREISVPDHISFLDFHEIIQAAFGWTNSHLFQFSEGGYGSVPTYTAYLDEELIEEEEQIDADTVRLSEVFKNEGQKFVYIYDFGDSWQHRIELRKISAKNTAKAVLTAGSGACPPEDCGGAPGYERYKEVLNNPTDPEYEELREWLGLEEGEKWDPEAFGLQAAQAAVEDAY